MKNIFRAITLFIGAGILHSSCQVSLTKRHYRKGYHFNMVNKVQAPAKGPSQEQDRITLVSKEATELHREEKIVAVDAGKEKISLNPVTFSQKPEQIREPGNQAPSLPINASEKESSYVFSASKMSESTASRSSEDGLSLLWTVIVVILIIWAIAFIAGGWGLGGLINLLLLIALILLILWLLRII
jgi:hypothetical protein